MFRRTEVSLWQLMQSGPMMCNIRTRNKDLQKIIINQKERAKSHRYYGAWFQRNTDRELFYGQLGGPGTTKLAIKREVSRQQFKHWTHDVDKWAVSTVQKNDIFTPAGGVFFQVWDASAGVCDTLNDMALKWGARNMTKDNAIELCESWGLKYYLLDERSTPRFYDLKYWKHKLYAHNFPYLAEPVTGAGIGDPDWEWKGEGVGDFDYSVYGAKTNDERNIHRTLWEKYLKQQAVAIPVKPARANKSAAAKDSA